MTRTKRVGFVVALVLLPHLSPLHAAQDTTAVDTAAVADTLPLASPVVAIKEAETPPGPLPPSGRYVFTRDSILWSDAHTLSDLLGQIPGVYIARAGFLGLPEYVNYAGRGGRALEIYWDGVRLEPLGNDSLFLDPARIPLTLLRRVDVEVRPAGLRVYVVSERHERLTPRSFIQVGSGDFSTAAFAGMFQHRWRSGFELVAAADFVGTDGASGPGRNDQAFDVFAKFGWHPSPRMGASYQIRRQDHDRDAANTQGGVVGVPERRGASTDILFAMYAGTRDDGLGLRVEGGVGISAWDPDEESTIPEQRVRRVYLETRYQTPNLTGSVRGILGDSRTLSGVEGRFGWVPVPGLVLFGDARREQHEGDRTSRTLHGGAALYHGPFSLVGEIEWAEAVQASALLADSAQRTIDRSVRLGLDTRVIASHVGLAQRDAFVPRPFADLPIAALDSSGAATYLIVDVRLQPLRPLTARAWYSDRLGGDDHSLQPPRHGRMALTFRSKYWRTFRSGTFDIKLEVALESWDNGIAGLNDVGTPIPLPAATFTEALIEFQIAGFTGFWNLRNAGNTQAQYVPGMPYPISAQTFGVKWVFAN